jgi:TPR repeat protein
VKARRRALAGLAGLAALAPLGPLARRAQAADIPLLAEAHSAYHIGSYMLALVLFERAAAAGSAEAAECAAYMLLLGASLYGPQVAQNLPRAEALLRQAVAQGRPSARGMLNMLDHSE